MYSKNSTIINYFFNIHEYSENCGYRGTLGAISVYDCDASVSLLIIIIEFKDDIRSG